MSEIETREGVDLDALEAARSAANAEWASDNFLAYARMLLNTAPALIAELRAARTPAQTQTFKDGFAAGLEAAAKVAEELQCRTCGAWFHPNVNPHYDEDCPKGRASWDGARFDGDIPNAIRALKEPS